MPVCTRASSRARSQAQRNSIAGRHAVMYYSYIMALTRTQISLSDADRTLLDAASQRTGRSMSALIRDAIHSTYGSPGSSEHIHAALEATFGVLDAGEAGADAVAALRSGRRLSDPT